MINKLSDLELGQEPTKMTVEAAEQNLLFIGTHSSTGRVLVQFVQGEEAVCVEVQNPALRTKLVSLLLDGVGGELDKLRGEASQA